MTTTQIHGDHAAPTVMDRAHTALQAWREHGNWDKAAEVAGYTNRGSAYRAAMKVLAKRTDETIHALRVEANQRHAEKIAVLEEVMYDLDAPMEHRLRAVAEHTRAEARHARLNGLDAPMQVMLSSGSEARLNDVLAEATELITGMVADSDGVHTITDVPAREA